MANQILTAPDVIRANGRVEIGALGYFNPAIPAFIFGTNNWSYVSKYAFGGSNNLTSYDLGFVIGVTNTLSGDNWGGYNFCFGSQNTVHSSGLVGGINSAFGNQLFVTGDCQVGFGKSNTIYGKYGIVVGQGNTMTVNATYCQSSGIIGENNYMSDSLYSFIAGYQNTIGRNNNYNLVAGQGNTITDLSGANHNAVFGQKNTVNGGDMNLVAGGNATAGHNVTGGNNIVGGYANTVSGSQNLVVGGYRGTANPNIVSGVGNIVTGWGCTVSGDENFVSGQTCSSAGTHNIVQGRSSSCGGSESIVVGYGNGCTGADNAVFGEANVASGYALMYGRQNLCSSQFSMAGGHQSHASNYAERALASGWWGSNLHAQTSELVLKASTTDAVATELSNPSGFLTIANTIAYTFVVTITAKDTANTDHASYRLEWSTVRGANAATTTVDGLIKTVIFESQAAWDVNVTADTVNGRPAITVTGEVGKTIHWVARVEITETP